MFILRSSVSKPDCKCVYLCALVFMFFESAWVSPLVYDSTVVYRGSLDCSVLAASLACIVHLIVWVVVWLAFIVIPRWDFTVRMVVAKARLSTPTAVKMVAEIEHREMSIPTSPSSMASGAAVANVTHFHGPLVSHFFKTFEVVCFCNFNNFLYHLLRGFLINKKRISKCLYHKEGNHLLILCVFLRDCSSNFSQKYKLGNF
jgi:hypothetical protein